MHAHTSITYLMYIYISLPIHIYIYIHTLNTHPYPSGQDAAAPCPEDENGNSLLHIACQNNNRHIAKLLLKNGIGVNEINHKGNTPLHYVRRLVAE